MPIRNSKVVEIVGWSGVSLRPDASDLTNHELASASNLDLHTRIAVAAQRQGKERLFTSAPTAQWSTTDGGDMAERLGGLVQRLTRERGTGESVPVGLNRWEDRLLAGETFLPPDSGAKGTHGWEVDSHGAQPQPLPDLDIRRLAHRNATRYQAAGKHFYRDQKLIQDYRELECSTAELSSFVNYRPLLDNVEWTFCADRGQMIKDSGTVTRRWGIAPPPAGSSARWNCAPATVYGLTYIRYTEEATPKVAHESNPTLCPEGSSVGIEDLAVGHVELIAHPEDPQVNGIGIYRSLQTGGSQLLIRRVKIPQYPTYSVTYGWEGILFLGTSATTTHVSWVSDTFDNRYYTTGDDLRFQHAFQADEPTKTTDPDDLDSSSARYKTLLPPIYMGTQRWEPGVAAPNANILPNQAFSLPADPTYDRWKFIQNSEDVPQDGSAINYAIHGRHGTHRWEVDEGFVINKQSFRWAYGDLVAEGSLGAAVETDNDLPPESHYVAEHLGFTFLYGDDDNEHYLYWSKRFQPESWPADNYIEVGQPSDKSRGLSSLAGLLGIFTENTKYRLTGSDSDSFVYQEALSSRGCPTPLSLVACERGLLFAAYDGVWQTTLTSPDKELSGNILPLFMGQTVNGRLPIDWDYALRMAGEYHKNRYYLSYVSKGSTEIDTVAVYSFDTEQWSFYALDARSFRWEDDRNIMAYGATDGQLYQMEAGATSDVGLPIPFSFTTKEFGVHAAEGQAGSFIRCLWLFVKLDLTLAEGSATVKVYVDDTLEHTATVTGARTLPLLHLPEDTWGKRCKITVSGEAIGPVSAHGLSMAYLPLEHD